nr:MAG TPA: tail protein [Caudoviricetes sp.]
MTENLNLFANSSSVPIVISASQGESNARSFKIQIVGTDNLPIDLEGSTTSLYILIDPETEVQIPGIVEGTYVTFTLTYNSTLTAGNHKCWIQIIKPNDSDLRVDNLTLCVQECNIDTLAEQSPEFGALTQLITEAQEAITNANEAAEEASSTASTTATNVVNQQKAQPNGLATLDDSGKLVQMPTAADVGAVTQTVYELTLSDEWEPNSETSACFLIVTGKIATVIARIRPKEAKTFSSYTLCTLPEGIQIDKYIDAPLVCGGAQDQNMAVQVTPPNKIALFDGEYRKTPYSLNVSFKIV